MPSALAVYGKVTGKENVKSNQNLLFTVLPASFAKKEKTKLQKKQTFILEDVIKISPDIMPVPKMIASPNALRVATDE